MLILCLVGHEASWTEILKYGNCSVHLYILQRIRFGRNVGVDTGGAVFWIGEMENGTSFRRVFLGNDPNGVYLQVGEGRDGKRPCCVAQGNLF